MAWRVADCRKMKWPVFQPGSQCPHKVSLRSDGNSRSSFLKFAAPYGHVLKKSKHVQSAVKSLILADSQKYNFIFPCDYLIYHKAWLQSD